MAKTGKVLRIKKTSIHDGEGLRTVVFLKGCPLRCKWCSTPESQRMEIEKGYETSLYSSYDKIRELLPYLTSMYIDFKVADERRHEFYTGVSNKRKSGKGRCRIYSGSVVKTQI